MARYFKFGQINFIDIPVGCANEEYYKEYVIYSDHSRLLVSLSRWTSMLPKVPTYDVCIRD
jgi:hypothetical protein